MSLESNCAQKTQKSDALMKSSTQRTSETPPTGACTNHWNQQQQQDNMTVGVDAQVV
jgi:hypothetical protein